MLAAMRQKCARKEFDEAAPTERKRARWESENRSVAEASEISASLSPSRRRASLIVDAVKRYAGSCPWQQEEPYDADAAFASGAVPAAAAFARADPAALAIEGQ